MRGMGTTAAAGKGRGISTVAAFLPWVALVGVWFLWGSTYVAIRYAVETIPPLLMSGTRYLLAGLIVLALVVVFRRRLPSMSLRQVRSTAIAGIALLLGGNGLLSVGEVRLDSGVAALLVATVPLIMVLESSFLSRTRIVPRSAVALILGTIGVLIVVGAPGTHVDLKSAVTVLIGAFFWASGSVYLATAEMPDNPLVATGMEMAFGGAALCVVGLALGEASGFTLSNVASASAIGWIWLVIPGSLIGFTAYSYALRNLPTATVATYAYINPVVAVALGCILGDQALTGGLIVGGCAVVAAVAATLTRGQTPELEALIDADASVEVA